MLAALSSAHKLGLGLSGLVFVVFALTTAMLVPRAWPDFPGRRLGAYVLVSLAFFCGMIAAVWFFGKEKKAPEHHRSALAVRF